MRLRKREKIVIYGDYDVDGITSTAILYQFLSDQGLKLTSISRIVPTRGTESTCLLCKKDKEGRRKAACNGRLRYYRRR